jgi:hypothetical protein
MIGEPGKSLDLDFASLPNGFGSLDGGVVGSVIPKGFFVVRCHSLKSSVQSVGLANTVRCRGFKGSVQATCLSNKVRVKPLRYSISVLAGVL